MYISVTPLLLPHLLLWASICHFHMALHPLLTSPWLRPIHHSRGVHSLVISSGWRWGVKGTQMRTGPGKQNSGKLPESLLETIASQNGASSALVCFIFFLSPFFVVWMTYFSVWRWRLGSPTAVFSTLRENGTIMHVVLEGEIQACNRAGAQGNTTPQYGGGASRDMIVKKKRQFMCILTHQEKKH